MTEDDFKHFENDTKEDLQGQLLEISQTLALVGYCLNELGYRCEVGEMVNDLEKRIKTDKNLVKEVQFLTLSTMFIHQKNFRTRKKSESMADAVMSKMFDKNQESK